MKIKLQDFRRTADPMTAVVYSLDRSIYQVFLRTPAGEALLLEDDGSVFRRRNLQSVREALRDLPVTSLVLRQHSAYDEMIGHPPKEQDNLLELPLSMDDYPEPGSRENAEHQPLDLEKPGGDPA